MLITEENWQKFKRSKGNPDCAEGLSGECILIYYIDDILIYTAKNKGYILHLFVLEFIFHQLNVYGFILNKSKIKILAKNITFLGSNFNYEGYSDIPANKCQALSNIRSPRSHAELYSRMGQFGYVSSHIPFFAKIAAPLRQLMVAEKFSWSRECHLAFETIKLAVQINVKNYAVKPDLPMFIFTDASKIALGVFVCQIYEKNLRIVATQSRIFKKEDRMKSAVVRRL